MIKSVLVLGFLLCILYGFLQRHVSKSVAVGIYCFCLAGIWFVMLPEQTTALAAAMGVGRGADLLLYLWIVISVFVLMSLQVKILNLRRELTELARDVACRFPITFDGERKP